MEAEDVMRAAAYGTLIAIAFVAALRFLVSLRNAVDERETPLQTGAVLAAFGVFVYAGWWMFGPIISGLL